MPERLLDVAFGSCQGSTRRAHEDGHLKPVKLPKLLTEEEHTRGILVGWANPVGWIWTPLFYNWDDRSPCETISRA